MIIRIGVRSAGNKLSTNRPDNWREAYQAALLEVDPAKLPQGIEKAYNAIQAHLEFTGKDDIGDYQALADALANLRVLRREAGLPLTNPDCRKPESPASDG
jgi:hypothetical protein